MIFRDDSWECQRCGETFSKNVSECSECGHTILQQYRDNDSETSDRRTQQQKEKVGNSESDEHYWLCSKCKQRHDQLRDSCKVCGNEEFTEYGSPNNEPTEQAAGDRTDVHDDSDETISNVAEAKGQTRPSDTNRYWWLRYVWIALLLCIILYVLYT